MDTILRSALRNWLSLQGLPPQPLPHPAVRPPSEARPQFRPGAITRPRARAHLALRRTRPPQRCRCRGRDPTLSFATAGAPHRGNNTSHRHRAGPNMRRTAPISLPLVPLAPRCYPSCTARFGGRAETDFGSRCYTCPSSITKERQTGHKCYRRDKCTAGRASSTSPLRKQPQSASDGEGARCSR